MRRKDVDEIGVITIQPESLRSKQQILQVLTRFDDRMIISWRRLVTGIVGSQLATCVTKIQYPVRFASVNTNSSAPGSGEAISAESRTTESTASYADRSAVDHVVATFNALR
ncbi:hypothetical protein PC128_g25650 [Phytophthora cactorum]|nr:hypothetical protein PC128_g25650 [Phytophthora cactorum]